MVEKSYKLIDKKDYNEYIKNNDILTVLYYDNIFYMYKNYDNNKYTLISSNDKIIKDIFNKIINKEINNVKLSFCTVKKLSIDFTSIYITVNLNEVQIIEYIV